jgi:hypothetical protein
MSTNDHVLADYLSEEKLAAQLGINLRTLRRWRDKRLGPRFIMKGRQLIYNRDDIAAWLRAGGTAAPRPSQRR